MRGLRNIAFIAGAIAAGGDNALAASCANPNALGVSRVLSVDPRVMPLVGRHDYGVTLPLAPGEVVLTFDDGPRPPNTNRVLKALADECLRATFFIVGRQARAFPQMVRQVRAAGHSVGTHSQNHPMRRLSPAHTAQEIDTGLASVGAALGASPDPFFRFPGLYRSRDAESYLRRRGLMAWSIDVDSYDWKRISAKQMLDQTLARLEARRGGILLMHDVNPKTAAALPALIARIKARGFRIVHVVPSGRGLPDLVANAVPKRAPAGPPMAGPRNRGGGRSFDLIFTSGIPRQSR